MTQEGTVPRRPPDGRDLTRGCKMTPPPAGPAGFSLHPRPLAAGKDPMLAGTPWASPA